MEVKLKLSRVFNAVKTRYVHAKQILGEKKRQLIVFYVAVKSRRVKIAKWLFEKLLGSALISGVIVYGAILNVNLVGMSFQMVYSLITGLSVVAYVLSVVLIPKERTGEKIASPPMGAYGQEFKPLSEEHSMSAMAEDKKREIRCNMGDYCFHCLCFDCFWYEYDKEKGKEYCKKVRNGAGRPRREPKERVI